MVWAAAVAAIAIEANVVIVFFMLGRCLRVGSRVSDLALEL